MLFHQEKLIEIYKAYKNSFSLQIQQVAWIKLCGIRGCGSDIPVFFVPHAIRRATQFSNIIIMKWHGLISAESGCCRDIFLNGDFAGPYRRSPGASHRATANAFRMVRGMSFYHRRHSYLAGSQSCREICLTAMQITRDAGGRSNPVSRELRLSGMPLTRNYRGDSG